MIVVAAIATVGGVHVITVGAVWSLCYFKGWRFTAPSAPRKTAAEPTQVPARRVA